MDVISIPLTPEGRSSVKGVSGVTGSLMTVQSYSDNSSPSLVTKKKQELLVSWG